MGAVSSIDYCQRFDVVPVDHQGASLIINEISSSDRDHARSARNLPLLSSRHLMLAIIQQIKQFTAAFRKTENSYCEMFKPQVSDCRKEVQCRW
jgi:hypothetical protein